MPSHRRVSLDEVPSAYQGRATSSDQRALNESIQRATDEIRLMGKENFGLYFEYDADEIQGLKIKSATEKHAKDVCRRKFRKALIAAGVEDIVDVKKYEYRLERLGSGEMLTKGFSVYIVAKGQ